MSVYYFCTGCEYIKIGVVPGSKTSTAGGWSCPARFNPREGKWPSTDGVNPHECPRNEQFMALQKQSGDRKLR
jgi:hypothetical protein